MPLCSNFITDLAALQEHYYRTLFWLMWYWLTWSVWRVEELVLHKHKNTPSFDTYFSVCLWVCWEPPLKICSNSAEISRPVLHIVSRKETLICILWFSAKIMHRAVSLPLHLRTDICLKIYYRHWSHVHFWLLCSVRITAAWLVVVFIFMCCHTINRSTCCCEPE